MAFMSSRPRPTLLYNLKFFCLVFVVVESRTCAVEHDDCVQKAYLTPCPYNTTSTSEPGPFVPSSTEQTQNASLMIGSTIDRYLQTTSFTMTPDTNNPTVTDDDGTESPTTSEPVRLTCGVCADGCESCFGPGANNCTQCKDAYALTNIGKKEICKPCNELCFTSCSQAEDVCDCMDDTDSCRSCNRTDDLQTFGSCSLEESKLPLIIGVSIGGIVLIVLLVICIYCVCCRRIRPPKPVKEDYDRGEPRQQLPLYHSSPDDIAENTFINEVVVMDDVYGNVDNQGNMKRIDMPEEGHVIGMISPTATLPVRQAPMPSDMAPMTQQSDFGDIYENTVIPKPQATSPRPIPEIPSNVERQAESGDFGGEYTNMESGIKLPLISPRLPPVSPRLPPEIPSKEEGEAEACDFGGVYTNMESGVKLPQKTFEPGLKVPALPQKLTQQGKPLPLPPQLPTRPPSLDGPSAFPKQDVPPRSPFAKSESTELPTLPPPLPPTLPPTLPLPPTPQTEDLPRRPPPPTPSKKSASLPTPAYSGRGPLPMNTHQDEVVEDDYLPPQSHQRPPVSSSLPKQPAVFPLRALPEPPKKDQPLPRPPVSNKKKQRPPQIPPKRNVAPHIDDDILGDVEIGTFAQPVNTGNQGTPDYGGTYEVSMGEPSRPPNRDYGMSYEVVEVPRPQEATAPDFGATYTYADDPAAQEDAEKDYGGDYEHVEVPSNKDYGDEYEVFAQPPSKAKIDMRTRPLLPLPKTGKSPPPVVHRKPVSQNANNSRPPIRPRLPPPPEEEPDFGGDYTNVSAPGAIGGAPSPARRPPALPPKISNVKPMGEDFYEQALNFTEQDAKIRLEKFQQSEDQGVYQNNPSAGVGNPKQVSRYRNIPTKNDTPSKFEGYIKLQRT